MSIAGQLRRAELLSEDSSGRKIPKLDKHARGYTVMPVKETRPHALSHANTESSDDQLEQDRRERESRQKFDELDDRDRDILRLHLIRLDAVEHELPFPREQRADKEAAGWLFIRYSGKGERYATMCKSFVGQLDYEEIGERVGCSSRTVQRRLSAMDPVMVKFAELRGWT